MEKSIKLLAVSLLIGSLLLSAAIVAKSFIDTRYDRFYCAKLEDSSPVIFDNLTGKYYTVYYDATHINLDAIKIPYFREIDPINNINTTKKASNKSK
jgi:hypothetical protein